MCTNAQFLFINSKYRCRTGKEKWGTGSLACTDTALAFFDGFAHWAAHKLSHVTHGPARAIAIRVTHSEARPTSEYVGAPSGTKLSGKSRERAGWGIFDVI